MCLSRDSAERRRRRPHELARVRHHAEPALARPAAPVSRPISRSRTVSAWSRCRGSPLRPVGRSSPIGWNAGSGSIVGKPSISAPTGPPRTTAGCRGSPVSIALVAVNTIGGRTSGCRRRSPLRRAPAAPAEPRRFIATGLARGAPAVGATDRRRRLADPALPRADDDGHRRRRTGSVELGVGHVNRAGAGYVPVHTLFGWTSSAWCAADSRYKPRTRSAPALECRSDRDDVRERPRSQAR